MGLVLSLMSWNNISPILAPRDAEMLVDAPLEFYSQILEGNLHQMRLTQWCAMASSALSILT